MTSLQLAVSREAEREATRDAHRYEGKSTGLGAAFLDLVERALYEIVENPGRFPVVDRDVRRALVKRFPYGVFFRVRGNQVKVIAILHLSRDPNRWKIRR